MISLDRITLSHGGHANRAAGMCAMEAAAYIAGEAHSAQPACVSPAITAFMAGWNDGLPSDAERDRLLKPLIPLVIGTRTNDPAVEIHIGYLATDWFLRVHTPAWLSLAGHKAEAQALREFAPIASSSDLIEIQPYLDRAKNTANAAESATRSAAVTAAMSAAVSAAMSATWSATRSAAVTAAMSAANQHLAATVTILQSSATELVHRMAAVAKVAPKTQ